MLRFVSAEAKKQIKHYKSHVVEEGKCDVSGMQDTRVSWQSLTLELQL